MHKADITVSGTSSPVAVLELFTSEGCSSCPPADNLLPQLAMENDKIIPLSFHVDYWNYLGWADPFSSSMYSERQREYVQQFRLESAYTPQLIVNGEYEFAGSNRVKAEAAISNALKKNASVELEISGVVKNGNTIRLTVKATGETNNKNLEALLVQNKAETKVKAGENRGETLTHTNIVRSMASQTINKEANLFQLEIPKDIPGGGWKIVVIAKDNTELKVAGAAQYSPKE